MTTTTRVPAAEITGLKGALMKRMATKTLGKVPTALGVLAQPQGAHDQLRHRQQGAAVGRL